MDKAPGAVDKPPSDGGKGPFSVEKPGVRGPSISDVWEVPRAFFRARKALDRGALTSARELVRPLLETYGSVTFIRRLAAEILYASGDPLSAASFFERAAKKLPRDRAVAVGLVASYAALNRVGDARRASALFPEHVDVRLALAWAELAATGGDRARGAEIVRDLARDPELGASRERVAMLHALVAIVAASHGERDRMRVTLRDAERDSARLRAPDRAFLGYLCAIALRDAGLRDEARAAFSLAAEQSPESIGAALALRERAALDIAR